MDNLGNFPDILDKPLIPIKFFSTLRIVADFDSWPDFNFAFIRCGPSGYDIQKRCFSRAVRPHNPETISRADQKIKTLYQLSGTVTFFNPLKLDHFFA